MGKSARSLKSERALLLTAALAAMLLPLNSTMIAVAIPDIARDFGGDAGSATWLVSGYLIAMALPADSSESRRCEARVVGRPASSQAA